MFLITLFEITTYTLANWNRGASSSRTSFLFHDRETFAPLVSTSTSCDTRAKLFNVFRSLCVSDFSLGDNANLFWNTRAKSIDASRLLCASESSLNDNANLFCNVSNNLVFNDETPS